MISNEIEHTIEGKGFKLQKNTFTFSAYIIREQRGFTAICREVDVATEGQTIQKAKQNLVEAVSLYIESAIENNLPIIRPIPKEDDPTQNNSNEILEVFRLNVDLNDNAYA